MCKNIFSQSVAYLLIFLMMPFEVQKFWILTKSKLSFFFTDHGFGVIYRRSRKSYPKLSSSSLLLDVSYCILGFMFRSLIHLKLIFVYSVRSEFIFLCVDIQFPQHYLKKILFFLHWVSFFLFFYSIKFLDLELASWTQFRWTQFYWQHPKHHSLEPVKHVPSFPHQAWSGCWPCPINIIQLLHSLFDLVLVGLDIHNEHNCTVVFCLLHGWLSSQGELDDGVVVKLVSPGGALRRIFRLPSEPQCLRPPESGWRADLLFVCGCGCLLALLSLPSKPLPWLLLWEGQGLHSSPWAPSSTV